MYTYSEEGNGQFIDWGGNMVSVYLRVRGDSLNLLHTLLKLKCVGNTCPLLT